MFERTWTKIAYRAAESALFIGGILLIGHEAASEADQMSADDRSISNTSRIEGLEAMALMAGSVGMMMGERIVSARSQDNAEQLDQMEVAEAVPTFEVEHKVTPVAQIPKLRAVA